MTDSIICEKEIEGEPCGAEILLIPENLDLFRPEVPMLRTTCPACGNSNILTKEVSIPLVELYFKDEVESILAGEPDENIMPSAGFAQKVKDAMESMGYTDKKHKKKVKTICDFVKDVEMYQTPQGLHQLLSSMGIDRRHIELIVIRVFGTNDMMNTSMPNYSFLGQPQGNAPNIFGQPASPQNPNQQQVGPYIQTTTPQGQVILIPNPQPQMPPQYPYQQQQPQTPNQPIIIDRGGVQSQDEKITISEKVDQQGHVVERIISQPKTSYTPPAPTPNDGMNSMKDMVEMLGTMGVFKGNETAPGPDPQIEKMELRHEQSMNEMRQMNQQQQENLTALKDQMHQEEINNIKGYMGALDEKVKELSDPRFQGTMNTEQAKIRAQTDNLGTVSDHLESLGDRVLEPLAEAQKMQARTNGAITIRQMEIQEGLAPGTLLNVVFGNAQPSNDDVKATTEKWQKKAKE